MDLDDVEFIVEYNENNVMFDDQIEFDQDESDKENSESKTRVRSTKEQLKELDEFNEGDDESDKQSRWNRLTEKLNQLGPPNRSTEQWKSVISIRKYNKKRASHQGHPKQKDNCDDVGTDATGIQSDDFRKQVLQHFSESILNQHVIIKELKKTNSLLENMSKNQ